MGVVSCLVGTNPHPILCQQGSWLKSGCVSSREDIHLPGARFKAHTHSLKEERDMLQQGYIWTESWSFSLTHIPLIVASVMSCGVSSPPHTQMSTVMNITRQHPHRTAPYRLHSQPSSVGAVLPLHCTSGHQHSRTIIALWTTSSSSSAF